MAVHLRYLLVAIVSIAILVGCSDTESTPVVVSPNPTQVVMPTPIAKATTPIATPTLAPTTPTRSPTPTTATATTRTATPTLAPTTSTTTPPPATPDILGETLSSGMSIADLVDMALPSVVWVFSGSSAGTGFIVSSDEVLVTNNHVVGSNDQVLVQLASGDEYGATVLSRHAFRDIAFLQIDSGRPFTPLTLGDVENVRVGDEVIAIGYPLGERLGRDPTVSRGIVSAKRPDFLQTDAAFNPGNSGGPLLNALGEVVGVVVSRIETDSSGRPVDGIGFAIPINEVWSESQVEPSPTATPTTATPLPTRRPALTPTGTPVPTYTPTPIPATPHPGTYCREWEAMILEWIKEGNEYWGWGELRFAFNGQNRYFFAPLGLERPSLPGITATEGLEHCVLRFPRTTIPASALILGFMRIEHYERSGLVRRVGEGEHENLPGSYEYRWEGGTWVEGQGCKLYLMLEQGEQWAKAGAEVTLPYGEPFTITLDPRHGHVSLFGSDSIGSPNPCTGALYHTGEPPEVDS